MTKPKFIQFNGVNVNATHYKGKPLTEFKKIFKEDHKDNPDVVLSDEDFKELHDIVNDKPKPADADADKK